MYYLIAGLIGLLGGVTSGMFGVGGGIILVPAMVLFMKLNMKIAVATSLVVIIPTSLAGSVLNHSFGGIDWRAALAMAPLAVVGGLGGTWVKEQIPSANLQQIFGGFLVLVGCKLLFFK